MVPVWTDILGRLEWWSTVCEGQLTGQCTGTAWAVAMWGHMRAIVCREKWFGGVESEHMRPCCAPLWGARWLETIGILMNWADMRMGPSLLRRRSPATALEVKTVHEESRDRGVGGGVFSTVKGICRTWGCFLFFFFFSCPANSGKREGKIQICVWRLF